MQVRHRQRIHLAARAVEVLRAGGARVHGAGFLAADPFCDDGVQDSAPAAAQGGRGGGGARGDEDAEFAEEGEGGFVGLAEPGVGCGGLVGGGGGGGRGRVVG